MGHLWDEFDLPILIILDACVLSLFKTKVMIQSINNLIESLYTL